LDTKTTIDCGFSKFWLSAQIKQLDRSRSHLPAGMPLDRVNERLDRAGSRHYEE
jgi:hypothetical protein